MPESDYFEMNRLGWDRRAEAHFGSRFYNLEGFLSGETSLREIELAELKDVEGKSMLHLQCHFGMDTLSWARKGAVCTGVDLSPVAIRKARELAQALDAWQSLADGPSLAVESLPGQVFGLPAGRVRIVAGSSSPHKIVEIIGLELDEIRRRLGCEPQ